jgi:hypothetical protein
LGVQDHAVGPLEREHDPVRRSAQRGGDLADPGGLVLASCHQNSVATVGDGVARTGAKGHGPRGAAVKQRTTDRMPGEDVPERSHAVREARRQDPPVGAQRRRQHPSGVLERSAEGRPVAVSQSPALRENEKNRCQPSCRHTGGTRTHERSVKSWADVSARSAFF